MSFPNFAQKYDQSGLLTPESLRSFRQQRGRYPTQPPPHTIFFCYQTRLFEYAVQTYHGEPVTGFMGDVQLLRNLEQRIGVVGKFGIGAPATAVLLQDLANWGVQQFVIVGLAGGIHPDQQSGDWVLVDHAIRDEGTSHHYLPAAVPAKPTPALHQQVAVLMTGAKRPYAQGRTWTTDAPYRETPAEIRHYQASGVMTVEMEAATLFIVGQFCEVATAAAVVVSDRLTPHEWIHPPDVSATYQSLFALFDTVSSGLHGAG